MRPPVDSFSLVYRVPFLPRRLEGVSEGDIAKLTKATKYLGLTVVIVKPFLGNDPALCSFIESPVRKGGKLCFYFRFSEVFSWQ